MTTADKFSSWFSNRVSMVLFLLISISCPAASPNDEQTVVFYLAHQDDDIFIFSKLVDHTHANHNVKIIYTCSSFQKGNKYKKRRHEESLSALRSIGIDSNKVIFLAFPDGESHKHLQALIFKTDSIFDKIQPDIVYTTAYEGGHIDHDICNFVIGYLKYIKGYGFGAHEFPEYSAHNSSILFKFRSFPDTPATNVIELPDSCYQQALNYWGYYKSQKFPFGFYMAMVSGKRKVFGFSYLRPLPQYDYLELPPPRQIAYERYLEADFSDFRKAVELIH